MEGITTFIYRNVFAKYYGGVDTYYCPFISTHQHKSLNHKEINEILPEHNIGINMIPQVMTNNFEDFIYTVNQITEYGYNHINLNFGCPSGTVTSKNKGSGILVYPEMVEKLLDDIFTKTDLKISVKTRIGYAEEAEWKRLAQIYAKFPLEELIIHARLREDFYNDVQRLDAIAETLPMLSEKFPLSYNGSIYSDADLQKTLGIFSDWEAVMLGRGVITDPSLAKRIKNEDTNGKFDIDSFKKFNMDIVNGYAEIMSGDKDPLFKVKELWFYMGALIEDASIVKKIKKTKTINEFEAIINSIQINNFFTN